MTRPTIWHFLYDDLRNPWVGGGGAVRAWELYRRLRDEFDITVWHGAYPGARAEDREGIRYVPLGSPSSYPWSRWTFARAARRLLERGGYDVALVEHSPYTPLRVPSSARVMGVVHHLTGPTAVQRWGQLLGALVAAWERRQLARYARIAATSFATAAALQRCGVRAPVSVIPAGVDDALFALPRRWVGPTILYLGRLDAFQKGLDVLLAALGRVVHRCPDVRLWLAGQGRDEQALRRKAEELGVATHIRWWGPVSEKMKHRLLTCAAVFVLPSRFEGFGIAAAEAMAAGVPVVATSVGSLPEVVGDGGVLVPADDPGALATALEVLLSDPERRRRLGEAARQRAGRFRWSAIAASFAALLQDHVARR